MKRVHPWWREVMIALSPRYARVVLVAGLTLGCLLPVRLWAQAPTASAGADEPLQRIKAAQVANAAALEEARRTAKSENADAAVESEVVLLQQIELVYAEQLAAVKRSGDLADSLSQMAAALQRMQTQGLEEDPPYSILRLDSVQDELDAAREEADFRASAVRSTEEALQQASEQAEQREQMRRTARETLEVNADSAQTVALEAALRLAQLESRLATERATLQGLLLQNEQQAQAVQNDRVSMLQANVALLEGDACLKQEELDTQLSALQKEEDELRRSLAAARRELDTADRRLMQAKQRALQQEENAVLAAEVNARWRTQETLQLEVASLTHRLQRVADLKAAWQRRYQVSEEKPTRAQLGQWLSEGESTLMHLNREERLQRSRLSQLRQTAKALNDDIVAQVAAAPEVARWRIEEQERLQDQSTLYDSELTSLENARRIQEKLVAQIERRAATRSWRDRAAALGEIAQRSWAYEIAAVDDRPITIGKVGSGIVLFLFGLWITRKVSRLLGRRIFPRLGLDVSAAAALQSISFYILFSLLALFALNVARVPLTVFTFVGGALAIGVGFGSQNIVNNFISGLILLAERPIKVGDLIDVDGTRGSVERIGPRSTRIRLGNNVDILVPNSAFLEKNVINWTLADNLIRTSINVGVAYGSPIEKVRALLLDCVGKHDRILLQPVPNVIFADFAADALAFEVQFWIRMRTETERRNIESDVRFRIDNAFQVAGIVFAFPQLDVHLDGSHPFPVRIVMGQDET